MDLSFNSCLCLIICKYIINNNYTHMVLLDILIPTPLDQAHDVAIVKLQNFYYLKVVK